MSQTNKQYMSDEARIGRVVRNLMDVEIKALKNPQNQKHIDHVVWDIVAVEELSEQKLRDGMTYAEFASLAHFIGGHPDYDAFFGSDSYLEQMLYFRNLAHILTTKTGGNLAAIPAKMFLGIPLKAFYSYMIGTVPKGSPAYWSLKTDFSIIQKDCPRWGEYTIENFLWHSLNTARKEWLPTQPIEEHREAVHAAYLDIGRLLVDSFRAVFPEKFQIDEIFRKYCGSREENPKENADYAVQTADFHAEDGQPSSEQESEEIKKARAWIPATVQFNCHIHVDGMLYSAPYQYIGKSVDVWLTDTDVNIFCGGEHIASHGRLYGYKNKYSTIVEHMPRNTQDSHGWSSGRFLKWAETIGENTTKAVDAVLRSRQVEQQAYNACIGILKLAKKYSSSDLEEACRRVLSLAQRPSYKNILNHMPAPS